MEEVLYKIAINKYNEIGMILGMVLEENGGQIDYYYGVSLDGYKWSCGEELTILANSMNEYFKKEVK